MGIGYMTEGLDPELGGWEGWSADNAWELERGWITQGATLDELAANLAKSKWDDKMDADKLKASVERWNELVDKGVDEDFGREEMGKIETGPFYAIPSTPASATPSAAHAATSMPTSWTRTASPSRACTQRARSAT